MAHHDARLLQSRKLRFLVHAVCLFPALGVSSYSFASPSTRTVTMSVSWNCW